MPLNKETKSFYLSIYLSIYLSKPLLQWVSANLKKNMKPISIFFEQLFLVKHKIVKMQHSPYLPDLALSHLLIVS